MTKKTKDILAYLERLYPSYDKFLNYSNNFELLIAVVLSAQTTDKRVNEVTPLLFFKYPNPIALSKASYEEVLKIIKPLGLAKTKAKNIINLAQELMLNYKGEIPSSFDELIKLPGVGRKTANVVLALGFNIPSMPVDTHVARISKRLGFADIADDVVKIEENLCKKIDKKYWITTHHRFILFGRNICLAKNPKCDICELKKDCLYGRKDS